MPATPPDTGVLVAALCSWHEHDGSSARALEAILRKPQRAVLAAPVLLETNAVRTRLPSLHRLSSAVAASMLRANLANLRIVAIDGKLTWELVFLLRPKERG